MVNKKVGIAPFQVTLTLLLGNIFVTSVQMKEGNNGATN